MKFYQVVVTKIKDPNIKHIEIFKTENLDSALEKSSEYSYEIKEISEEKYRFQQDILKNSSIYRS